ncbi:hypothetical protein COU78_02230 [Candidatus Peregrinibacteria bacterium CG10_big_fil_rev_8_21_14_0_10_49_24]|nr:MAG: hypothetical protein COV83_02210 [Candidatus Peregrinibacteria bacterium CG11_big_fil_rev_8_21_14_0_20_49_14]PIR50955.1 MAG: hypothetical protein COU78_02230 [Candidatus Peregrinibacteria bacterium CG10_big_fil_rev_8_21_14_0_10_49_24]PJA67508.1 MAG: hypothetical protein CO157_03710 [Candidatus Peregrinibacteria bacterium CG_4_9_14_3_um_filter_49_12]
MKAVEIQGVTKRPIQPFGEEWIPDEAVDIQTFVTRHLNAVQETAREKLIIVVQNTTSLPDQEWLPIPPASDKKSTYALHAEFLGKVDMLIWKLQGKERAPTRFISSSVASEVMHRNAEMLRTDADDISIETGKFAILLNAIATDLASENPFRDVNGPHTLLWEIVKDCNLESASKFISSGVSLTDRIIHYCFGDKKGDMMKEFSRVRELCRQKISNFNDTCVEELIPDTYAHDWCSQPDSSVIAWNRLPESDSEIQGPCAMHFALPDSEMNQQDDLLRAEVLAGKITARRPKRAP